MRRLCFLLYAVLLAAVYVAVAVHAQESAAFVGKWYGELEVRSQRRSRELSRRLNVTRLPTSLEITRANDGTYSVEQISINQGNARIPVTRVTVEGDTIRWSAPAVEGSYEGRLSRDGTKLTGQWTQNRSTNPLNFERVEP